MKPILFEFGIIKIYSFGVMVALGILFSLVLMLRRARRERFPNTNDVWDMVFVPVLVGFIGGRIYYAIEHWGAYARDPFKIFAIWEGGLIFYGGAIAALVGTSVFFHIRKIPILKGFDFLIPYVALTQGFGRLGCFLNGCCYGKICDLPWGVRFPHISEPVHPTQLYESFFVLGLFFFLLACSRRIKFEGQIVALYMILYALGRFVIEFYRANNPYWKFLTWNQWISLSFFVCFILFYIFRSRHQKNV